MHYGPIQKGQFLRRLNRFSAWVRIDGTEELCHVKNTGRCKELLVPGTRVWCQEASSPARKTRFDLIAVEKGGRLINMDSQAPNAAAKEWLLSGGFGKIEALRAETVHGDSRFDFSFFRDGKLWFLEVKGVTLEENGVCAFPDAPTLRGVKHLEELAAARQAGYQAALCFIVQLAGAKYVQPNDVTHPQFGQALRQAAAAGVEVFALGCSVTPDSLTAADPVPVRL